VQSEIFAEVLTAPSHVEGDTDRLQRLQANAGRKDFVGNVIRNAHTDDGQAVLGLAVRLIALEQLHDLHIVELGLLNAEKCNFHSRTGHLFFLTELRVIARVCLSAGRAIPTGELRVKFFACD
jgi:hypothetical protein